MLSLVFRDTQTKMLDLFAVPEGEVRIGREVGKDEILLPYKTISRCHARVTRSGRGVRLEDLGSKNGILVGRKRVPSVLLLPGDPPVQLGQTFLTLEESDTGDTVGAFALGRAGCPDRAKATLPLDDEQPDLPDLDEVVHESAEMRAVLIRVRAFTPHTWPVLLIGETGTGKEVLAKWISEHGPNPGKPWPVNCAAIPKELIQSELFGVEEGVATGVRGRGGHFAAAAGGTLFLDEVHALEDKLQQSLLRALEERTILPAGARRQRTVHTRVILATNEPDKLRDDLRQRCSEIVIPPLRDRRADIRPLIRHFLQLGSPPADISESAVRILMEQDWPGNARQLRRVLSEAVALYGGNGMLHAEHICDVLGVGAAAAARSLRDRLAAVTRNDVTRALRESDGNKSAAARSIGMSRSGLRKAIERLGLER